MTLRRLFWHTSHYSAASLLTTVAGLVSFPFLTRVFSVADYGLMNLVSATLTALVAVGKLGLQQAVVRLHSGVGDQDQGRPAQPAATAVVGMAAMGLLLAACCMAAIPFLRLGDTRLPWIFRLASILVLVQVVESAFVSILRAEQRTGALAGYQVGKKYLGLGCIIAALLLIGRDLFVFYSAQVLTDLIGVVLLVLVTRAGAGRVRFSLDGFSRPLLMEMLRYGVPLMLGWELAGIILSLGDRYLVQALLGSEPLGTYAAAYNLCQYVEVVLLTPWGLAVTPMYVRLWDDGGSIPTRAFIERSLCYYILFSFPVVAGMSAVGAEVLGLLASAKYLQGATVIPYIVAGLAAAGAVPITGAGIFIEKRTWTAARYVVVSAVLNLLLNAVLIPARGIQGAAIATLLSYCALLVWITRAGSTNLRVSIPWGVVCRAAGASLAMYVGVTWIPVGSGFPAMATRVGFGVLIYSVLIVAVERSARDAVKAFAAMSSSA